MHPPTQIAAYSSLSGFFPGPLRLVFVRFLGRRPVSDPFHRDMRAVLEKVKMAELFEDGFALFLGKLNIRCLCHVFLVIKRSPVINTPICILET